MATRRRQGLLLAAVCVMVAGIMGQKNDPAPTPKPFCTNSAKAAPNAPPLPKLPPQYEVHMEANFHMTGSTFDIKEFVDTTNNRGAVHTEGNGIVTKITYNYKTNELFTVVTQNLITTCTVSKLNVSQTAGLFGWGNGGTGAKHVFTIAGALRFGGKFKETYMGTTTIRGIYVNHWQSCQYWSSFNANFTVDYYFTASNWSTPADSIDTLGSQFQNGSVPVRAYVNGFSYTRDKRQTQFQHTYEFYRFRSTLPLSTTVFETPPGVICPGRLKTKPVPFLNAQYSYRMEISSIYLEQTSQADVWYDYNYNLVRYDYKTPKPVAPAYSTDPTTEIHDYSTGVAYIIDKLTQNCFANAILNTSFDLQLNKTALRKDGAYLVQMKGPNSLFYLDNTYTYQGTTTFRSMIVDRFVSLRTDFDPDGTGPSNYTFEFYFLDSVWSDLSNVGPGKPAKNVPIGLRIYDALGYEYEYNFYDFTETAPSLVNFDITPCFSDSSRLNFQITFPGPYMDVMPLVNLFTMKAIQAIATFSVVSPIRIQHSRITYDDTNVYMTAILLDKAPYTALYRKVPGVVLQYRNDLVINQTTSSSACANFCSKTSAFICNSFDICPKIGVCSLSKSHTSDGPLVKQASCNHYSRTVSGLTQTSLSTAWIELRNNIYMGGFTIKLLVGKIIVSYTATSVSNKIASNPSRKLSGAYNIKQFTSLRNKYISSYHKAALPGVSVDDCAVGCLTEQAFDCQSFDYCFTTGACYLSTIYPDERPALIKPQPFCDLYMLNYVHRFIMSPGKTILYNSPVIYQNINTANQCAKLCFYYSGFACKSFDYCSGLSACFLGTKHIFTTPVSGQRLKPQCNTYSRTYLNDFKRTANKQIKMSGATIVNGVTPDQCAKMCEATTAYVCKSFDFCPNTTTCRMTSKSLKNVGQVTLLSSAYCSVYTRQYYANGQLFNANAPGAATYSKTSLGLAAFFMFLIGIICAAVAIYLYNSKSGGRYSPTAVSYKKEPLVEES